MKLSSYLKLHRLNQTQFARAAGISQTTIMRLLEGSMPQRATAAKIIAASNGKVSYADLAREVGEARAASA